ncbi:hypothetical protein BCR37DRAFT_395171 [Protomyces lactucae-debilis]|uniref:Uncharacterized protein n=1 Tax=Protomyces lactucae-debilis TaxID=2754530 RepID=A0A1Y2EYH7_PROLT|nr:uncharacterized protein BCR37DRAFT_395171 [Protomyces lactucae-debilis]ORY76620.1 hypothetical protein BCR37DRAFT_395171 [Protomyces lactucae-debilis]
MFNPPILYATEFDNLSSIAATVGIPIGVLESVIQANDLSNPATVVPNEHHEDAFEQAVRSNLQKRAIGDLRTPTVTLCDEIGENIRLIHCRPDGGDSTRFQVSCDGEPMIWEYQNCENHEICIDVNPYGSGVLCETVSDPAGEIEDPDPEERGKDGEAQGNGVVGMHKRLRGSRHTGAVIINPKRPRSGGSSRQRTMSLTAFLLTPSVPYETSQHPWLVKPTTAITCSVNGTGEKLCETDLSSTSMNTYTCVSTAGKHIVDDSSVISCTFRLAATQTAVFVSVGIWRYVSNTKTIG